jgi:hypothetical protein
MILRMLGVSALTNIAWFCAFGFLAAFELSPSAGLLWQVGYGVLGCGCLTGAIALLGRRRARFQGTTALLAITIFSVLGFVESSLASRLPSQAAYAALMSICLAGAVALVPRQRRIPKRFPQQANMMRTI